MPDPALILFACPEAAAAPVAGLPAISRIVRAASEAGIRDCWIDAGTRWQPSAEVAEEIARLAGPMRVHGLSGAQRATDPLPCAGPLGVTRVPAGLAPETPMLLIRGEALPAADAIRRASGRSASAHPALRRGLARDSAALGRLAPAPANWRAHYAALGRALIKATAKPGDGIVSRHLNRPVSQTLSGLALRIPGIRPMHATYGTALLGMAMFCSLVLLGSPLGLVAGALLFHAASVFDGVDGEMARVTHRCSDRGAAADSLVDAAVNIGFLLGIVINLALRHHWNAVGFGLAGMALLAAGLAYLGMSARRSGGPLTFDGAKHRLRGSRTGQWLIWLTMRDFLALAAVVLVVAGFTEQALVGFSVVMAGWLIFVLSPAARMGTPVQRSA